MKTSSTTCARGAARRRLGALAAAAALVVTAAAPAWGDDAVMDDPDDTGGAFDVVQASHGHVRLSSGQTLLRHGFELAEAWENEALKGHSNRIVLLFDLGGDRRPERRMDISVSEDGSLVAPMVAERGRKPDVVRGYAHVWRPSETAVEIVFPRSLLARRLERYGWRLETLYHHDDDPDCGIITDVYVICYDTAPDRGRYEHAG